MCGAISNAIGDFKTIRTDEWSSYAIILFEDFNACFLASSHAWPNWAILDTAHLLP